MRELRKQLHMRRVIKIGAGEGNRTLVSALGRPHSTIEPHPLTMQDIILCLTTGKP